MVNKDDGKFMKKTTISNKKKSIQHKMVLPNPGPRNHFGLQETNRQSITTFPIKLWHFTELNGENQSTV